MIRSISSLVERIIKENLGGSPEAPKAERASDLELRLYDIDYDKSYRDAREGFIKNYLRDILVLCLGNVRMAADIAGIDRRHMHRLLKRHGIDPHSFRKDPVKYSMYLRSNVQDIADKLISDLNAGHARERIYSQLDGLSSSIAQGQEPPMTLKESLHLFDREFLQEVVRRCRSLDEAAGLLGISKRTLYRKIK